jgi:hypothetical protein
VFDHPTVEAIADHLVRDVLALAPTAEPGPPATPATPGPHGALDTIEQLSDEEVERLFAERLRESRG